MTVLESNQLPACASSIPAVRRHGEHAEDRQQPRGVEEWRAIHRLEVVDLLRRCERCERCRVWMTSAKRHLKLAELRPVVAGEPREKCRQRAIDEVHDAGV